MGETEQLTLDEQNYHLYLLNRYKAALAAWQYWSEWISVKYKLADGDTVDEVGRIVRKQDGALD